MSTPNWNDAIAELTVGFDELVKRVERRHGVTMIEVRLGQPTFKADRGPGRKPNSTVSVTVLGALANPEDGMRVQFANGDLTP